MTTRDVRKGGSLQKVLLPKRVSAEVQKDAFARAKAYVVKVREVTAEDALHTRFLLPKMDDGTYGTARVGGATGDKIELTVGRDKVVLRRDVEAPPNFSTQVVYTHQVTLHSDGRIDYVRHRTARWSRNPKDYTTTTSRTAKDFPVKEYDVPGRSGLNSDLATLAENPIFAPILRGRR